MAIILSRSKPTAPDPIVDLWGGPGSAALLDASLLTEAGLNRNRDLIVLAQRGTYLSQPALTCPEIDQFETKRVGLVYDAASTGDQYVQAVAECRRRLAASGIDLAAYNTAESAADLADLRKALGIKQWNVFGHSYGTDLALTYMRLYPEGIRSVTLDGVTPPSAVSPGQAWASLKEAFDNIVRACAAQPRCQTAYPNIAATFTRQVSQLEAHPLTAMVTLPEVGDVKVVLDGGVLVNWLILASHDAANFPLAVDELAHGQPQRIAEQWAAARYTPSQSGIFSHGLYLSVACSEWVPYESAADQLRQAQQAFPSFPTSVQAQAPQFPSVRQACGVWNVPKAPASIRSITYSTIPTLVMSGSFDAQTGAQWGAYVARTLPNSTVVTQPGVAHGTFRTPCGAQMITSFYDRPKQADASCVAAMQPAPFNIGPQPLPPAKITPPPEDDPTG